MIYLDNAATTKPNENAVKKAMEFLQDNYFNPSALYKEGFALQNELKTARNSIVGHIADTSFFECVFTSCGTESDNTAVFNYAKRGNAVTDLGEHSAIMSSFSELKNRGVCEPRYAKLNSDGSVDVDDLLSLIDEKTTFVSIMHVNNETGAVNDINAIAKLVKKKNPNVIFHSDGVQGYGKIPFRLSKDVDLYSVSAHKIGGLKGVGALIKRKSLLLRPYIIGGGQESGRRSGTENVFGIKVFEYCANDKYATIEEDTKRLYEYKKLIIDGLDKDVYKIISSEKSSPYITSISAPKCRGEILLHIADDNGLIIGTGSACSSNAKTRYSRVIMACGYDEIVADGVLRLSFSPLTTKEEVEKAIEILNRIGKELKGKM